MYYYGARYYEPGECRFYGVDPLTEKYPSMGGYVYCANNPVRLVDPDGNGWLDKVINESKQYLTEKKTEFLTKAGVAANKIKDYTVSEGSVGYGVNIKVGPFSGSLRVEIAAGKSEDGIGDSDFNIASRIKATVSSDLKKVFSVNGWKGTGVQVKAGLGVKLSDKPTVNTQAVDVGTKSFVKSSANILGNGGEYKVSYSENGPVSINADVTAGAKAQLPLDRTIGIEKDIVIAAKLTDK